MRILIADDDPLSRRLLEAILVKLGHDVTAVKDGDEAVAALLRPDGPRLAILDWMMPGADGLAVCRALRQRATPYVYVILLTGRDRREDRVAGLDAEADDFLTKPLDAVELRARLRSGQRMLESQERLLEAQEALRVHATRDDLTGTWNRRMILEKLDTELSRAKREGRSLAVVMADLDHFKQVNDTYGHAAGDAVLRQTAERVRSVLRAYDSLGRYGGEEFLLLLPGCDLTEAQAVAERARAVVCGEPVIIGDVPLAVSLSLGVALNGAGDIESAAVIQAADQALYRAKQQGRNRVESQG